MYAIIENGGKQYKAVEGGYIEIDLLPDEVGKKKIFDKVLLLSVDGKTEVGKPYLKGASVDTTIVSHFKAPKIIVFKYRAKQRYRVKTGHRQKHSRVIVDSIAFQGKSAITEKNKEISTSKKSTLTKNSSSAAKKSTTKSKAELKKTAQVKAVKSTIKEAKKNTKAETKSSTVNKSTVSTAKKKTAGKAKTIAKKAASTKAKVAKKPTSTDKK
ncbi:MAG: 50S ribosomal protein L21 [Anaerolineaceae bacterium]|nr:50S ribosomal protein L21 [Anaerolineaceae bacterium]